MGAKSRAKAQNARHLAHAGGWGTTTPPTPQPLSVMPDWADGSATYGAATTRYGNGDYPGYTSTQDFVGTDEYTHPGIMINSDQNVADFAWDVGGQPGAVARFGYTAGTVDTNTVENFEMTGRVIKVRRPPEGIRGPVATADYAGGFLSAYAQSSYRATPDALLYPDLGSAI